MVRRWKLVGCLRRPRDSKEVGLAQLVPDDVELAGMVVNETIRDRHTTALNGSRGGEDPYDLVVEMWVEAETPPPVRLDHPALVGGLFWTLEHEIVAPPAGDDLDPATHRKVVFPLRRRLSMPHDDFALYWRHDHAPLVASHAETLGIRRYVQSHTSHQHTLGAAYDGLAEVWTADADVDAEPTPERAAAGKALLADEAHFIDLARSTVFWTRERVIR